MDFNWYELSSKGTIFKYKTDSFTTNSMGKRFSRLNHEYMLIAVASYGGPIALTSDKTQILTVREDDPSIKNLCIYNNEGEISHSIKLDQPFKNIIVHLEFLQDQMLLVLFQKGMQWLVDPHTGKFTIFRVIGLYEQEEIRQAKAFDNGFVILTSRQRFLYVKNAQNPQCLQFQSCEQILRKSAVQLFWTVFSPKQIISQKVELHLCHPEIGIIQVVESQSKRIFYNNTKNQHVIESKLPNLRGVTYISQLSPNKKSIVYFLAQPIYKQNINEQFIKKKKDKTQPQPIKQICGYTYKLVFAPSLTSDAIGFQMFNIHTLNFIKSGTHVNINQSPLSICWCGNKAVVIQFYNQQLYLYSVEGQSLRIQKNREQKNKWTYLKQEVDGVRLITKNENKILRQIPASYIGIFQAFSEQSGALLYLAYVAFDDEQPLQDDQIRKQKKKLATGVDQCVKASRFQINFDIVIKLMKAAAYGKAFLPPNMIPNNLIYDTSKILRVVYCLRQKQRYITFQQLQSLNNESLLKILLRYREHYLAFEIYQYLKKDQNFKIKIYTDWACCKVESQNESEEIICEEIKKKIQKEKGISFTQISKKAIEAGKNQLAMGLLSFQPSLAKKIPLLLWMGSKQITEQLCARFYQKALQQALKSKDLNLLILAIRKIFTSNKMPRQQILKMFTNHREGRPALLNYFRLFDSNSYIQYNKDYLKDTQTVIMYYLRVAYNQRQYQNYRALLLSAAQLFKQYESPMKQDWRKQTIKKIYNNLCQFMKHKPQIRFRVEKIKPIAITKQLQSFLLKKDSSSVNELKNYFKITDKRVIMTQIKIFIQEGKWDQLEVFVDKHKKKYNLPIELISDKIFARKEQTCAMKILARMSEKKKQQQYLLLQRIGRVKQAIMLATDRKDIQSLEQIQSTLIDANLIALCNDKISSIRKK